MDFGRALEFDPSRHYVAMSGMRLSNAFFSAAELSGALG